MACINSLQDLKFNYEQMVEYRRASLNVATYKYNIPITPELYNEVRKDECVTGIRDWCKKNRVAYGVAKGGNYSMTINYETDEESVDFESTHELNIKLAALNNSYMQWVNIDYDSGDNEPLLKRKLE